MEDPHPNGRKIVAGERAGSMLSMNYPLASYQQMNQFGAPSMHSLCSTVAPSTIIEQQAQRLHENFIIDDYMQKIDTKIELLENELKFAWRALDLLTTEYSKMAQNLDKIDKLAGDQQLVVQNLINLTLHNDAKAYEDMLANSDRYEAFRRKVLQEAAAGRAPYQINDLEFDSDDMNLSKLNVGGLQTIPDMESTTASLYDLVAATENKPDIPIYYSSNPFRDANMFDDTRDDMGLKLTLGDNEELDLLATMRLQKKMKMEKTESDNFEHFKKRLETMKQDVYTNNGGGASMSNSLVASESNANNVQSYLKELIMAQRVGEGLEEGIDPIADLGNGLKHSDMGNSNGGAGGEGIQRGQRSSKRNRSQHKKLIANEMELLNNQMLQRRQLKSNQKDEDQKESDLKRAVLCEVVARLMKERYQHLRSPKNAENSLITSDTMDILNNETYLIMRIFFFFYMRSTSLVGERERAAMLWKFIGQVLGGPEVTEMDESGIAELNNHIQATIQTLKTLSAADFQDHLQKNMDEVKMQPLEPQSYKHMIDFDIESFFCKGSSPKISISTVEDFELQIEKEDEPKASTSSSCYQFELIKRRYEMEEQKGQEKPLNCAASANPSFHPNDPNEHIYNNDQYIQSLKRNLERHNSMLYLLHLQGQDKDKCDLEDDKNKLMLDMMMDKLLQEEDIEEAGPVASVLLPEAEGDLDEMNCSSSPPPPAPIAPFLCREQDEDSEDGIEYDDDCNADDVFARMMTEGNMNVDEVLNRGSYRELLQFESWNDFAPECDQNTYGYGDSLNRPLTGKVVHSKPKASQSSYNQRRQQKQHDEQVDQLLHGQQIPSPGNRLVQYAGYDTTEVDSNLKYLEQMGRSQPICSPFENQSRFIALSTYQQQTEQPVHPSHTRDSQLTGPPDLLKLYLEQQHLSSSGSRSRAPERPPPPRSAQGARPRSESSQSNYSPAPPIPQRLPPSEPMGGHSDRGSSKKRKFQMVAKLQHWLHDQSSSSGNESRSAEGHSGSWIKKKHFRFRSQSLSEPMRGEREAEVSDQESLDGGYMVGGRRRSFMKTVKKEIGKRVRKVIDKGAAQAAPYSSHPELAASDTLDTPPDYSLQFRRLKLPAKMDQSAAPEFATVPQRTAPISVQVSEALEADDMNDLFLKVGDHPKPNSPAGTTTTTMTKQPDDVSHRSSVQYLSQGNSASLSSSNSATSSGGESGGLGGVNAQNSGPNPIIFNNSTSMEFAASRKVGKYRKGKRESSSEGHSDAAESANNTSSSGDANGHQSVKAIGGDPMTTTVDDDEEVPMTSVTQPAKPMPQFHKNSLHFPHIQKVNSICIDEISDKANETAGIIDVEEDPFQLTKAAVTTNSSPSVHGANPTLLSTNWGSVSMDEDSRSQHSYRTIASGGTSRRQSTEDSIDTDDEYFCYELRKLEEMEREAHDISFLKESGRLPQFEFEDSNYADQVPQETMLSDQRTEEMVDDAIKQLFRTVVHPELKISSQMSLTRKLNVLRAFEDTRSVPAKRRDGSGLNFLMRGDEEERKSNIKFYARELRYLTNPSSVEEGEELSESEIDSPKEMLSRGSQSSGASSSTTSGPESNPDEFSDFEEELEGQDKLRDEYQIHNEKGGLHTESEEYAMKSAIKEQLISPSEEVAAEATSVSVISSGGGGVGVGGGSVVGGGASKWKLLKTLKDRKAEEKTNQEKIKEEEDIKDKVSVGGRRTMYYIYSSSKI